MFAAANDCESCPRVARNCRFEIVIDDRDVVDTGEHAVRILETRSSGQATLRTIARSSLQRKQDSRRARLNAARVTSAEIEPFQTRQACDRSVHGSKTLDAAVAGKQERAHAAHR